MGTRSTTSTLASASCSSRDTCPEEHPFPLVVRVAMLSVVSSPGTNYMVTAIMNAGSRDTNAAFWCEGNDTWL